MKKLSLVLMFCAAPALAQITVTPGEPQVSPTPQVAQPAAHPAAEGVQVRRAVPVKAAPSPTPASKQKSGGFFGFFRRLFGGGHAEKAVLAPKPTPKATPKPGVSPKPTTEKPKATVTPPAAATPVPAVSPKPASARKSPTPAPEATTDIPTPAWGPRPTLPADRDNDQYQSVKQQALKDAKVAALREKMIAILSAHPEGGEAYQAAAREYTAALFAKMRKLDPSNAEQINRKEGATNRRLDAGLPIVQ